MFTVYYANQLENQKHLLVRLLEVQPLQDPFAENVILVQSPGMAQWLQLQLAEHFSIAANFAFPMPSSFIWKLYKQNIAEINEQNPFNKSAMVWRLMRIIPSLLHLPAFSRLNDYLGGTPEQNKLFHLAEKIADLFDQYLVYRPEWINQWQTADWKQMTTSFVQQLSPRFKPIADNIMNDIGWQVLLWQALVADIQQHYPEQQIWHRANLYQTFLEQLQQGYCPKNLPTRIIVFGISAMPPMFLSILSALSQHIDIHLFFNSPSRYYWGDLIDHRYLEKLKQKIQTGSKEIQTPYDETLAVGNPLLASWGKLGRDFLYQLTQLEPNDIEVYNAPEGGQLLQQLQRQILDLTPTASAILHYQAGDDSITLHACHSPMREVEVLRDNLLAMFEQDPTLTPKDIVVMVADIDRYTPYIQAVFSQYQEEDKRYIPFSISDRKVTESDVLISTFLQLFTLKESRFSSDIVLSILDVPAIRQRFEIDLGELQTIRDWVTQSGIRFGLDKYDQEQVPNYNAWQNGIERMLLGYALKSEAGIWQDAIGFDYSEGLQGKLAGKLAHFFHALQQWQQKASQNLMAEEWRTAILQLIDTLFNAGEQPMVIALLKQTVHQVIDIINEADYPQTIDAAIIGELLQQKLNEQDNSLHFLLGKLNFCTLLPMRAIPFKVICLLGMNDVDFPRQLPNNSFDLMQYQTQKGDRSRREDDCYLFLEALLSARQKLYISYVGYSIVDNTEYEPSVLVNQLWDYMADHLSHPDDLQQLRFSYPMTVFSEHNFLAPHFSYAQEWLPIAQAQQQQQHPLREFDQTLLQPENGSHQLIVELDDLQQFVIAPIKYFFEQRLGVYLNENEQERVESEVFELTALAQYQLKQRLFENEPQNSTLEFEKAQREGMLPRAEFAFLQQEELEQSCDLLRQATAQYQQQAADSVMVDVTFELDGQEVRLQGQIDHNYQQQYVDWRIGKIRDQDVLKLWLNHLILSAMGQVTDSRFIGINKGNIETAAFSAIDQNKAMAQVAIYLQDFLQAQRQICILPTTDFQQYQKLFAEENSGEAQLYRQLMEQQSSNEFDKSQPYWQRLLVQTKNLDYAAIKQRFSDWFAQMLEQLEDNETT